MNAHLPAPTIWPAALATGATLAAAGLVTSPVLLVFGGALAFVALAGWVSLLTADEPQASDGPHASHEADAADEPRR